MTKLNRKAIEANLRNKLAKQYTDKIESLKERIAISERKAADASHRAYLAEREKLEAEDKAKQLEDWVQRLQEFMDMNEDDRKVYVEELRAKQELEQAMKQLKSVNYIQHLFRLLV